MSVHRRIEILAAPLLLARLLLPAPADAQLPPAEPAGKPDAAAGKAVDAGRVTAAVETTLVEVPIHVVDGQGRPMRGLKKEDFELLDDGQKTEIQALEVIDLEDFSKAPGATPAAGLPAAARRRFFLLFDLSFSAPVKMARARSAARDFVLNGMKNGDFAAVATYDVEKGLKLVLSFTADRDQVAQAVETLGLPSLTQPMADPLGLTMLSLVDTTGSGTSTSDREFADILSAFASASTQAFDSYQRSRVTAMLKSFEDLAKTLNSVNGRKDIIYFSEGFDSRLVVGATGAGSGRVDADAVVSGQIWKVDNDARFGDTTLQKNLQQMLVQFNRTDCVVHSFDISGLTDRSIDVRATFSGDQTAASLEGGRGRGQDSLFLMAHGTGGEVFKNTNDIPGQLEKLQEQTALVYLLVFAPRKLTEPGRFHTLKVKVKAPSARVSARSGYYEPRPFSKLSPMERRLATAQLIAYGLPRHDIVARVLAAPFRIKGQEASNVPVIIEVPGEKLLASQIGDDLNVEIYAYVTDTQLHVRDFFSQSLRIDLGKARASLVAGGIKFYGDLVVPPGSYWLKVLVRNAATGRSGLEIVPLTVPRYDGANPFVLAPLFHETAGKWIMVKGPKRGPVERPYPFTSGGESFIPSAIATVTQGEVSRISLVAYNVSGAQPLEVESRVKGADGKDLGEAKLARVGPEESGADGARRLLCSLETPGLAKGLYSLLVTIRSPESGREAQSAVPFEVR